MTTEEKQVTTAAAMFKRRREYRQLVSKDHYDRNTAIAREVIAKQMPAYGGNHLRATLAILQAVPNTPPMVVACFISAALDMIEGEEASA